MDEYLEEQKIIPRAVVETVRDRKKPGEYIYNAEVVFNGEHRVVATNCTTRDEAKAAAQTHVDAIRAEILRIGRAALAQFPVAKG